MYCMLLAQNAVHGAMAGYTGFCVGLVNNRLVYIPNTTICDNSPRVMDPAGRYALAPTPHHPPAPTRSRAPPPALCCPRRPRAHAARPQGSLRNAVCVLRVAPPPPSPSFVAPFWSGRTLWIPPPTFTSLRPGRGSAY
jgi:hypothetical protein